MRLCFNFCNQRILYRVLKNSKVDYTFLSLYFLGTFDHIYKRNKHTHTHTNSEYKAFETIADINTFA